MTSKNGNGAAFGKRLRALRDEAELTQEGLARFAGLSVSSVAKLEAGAVAPSFATACKLARALGVSVAAFDDDEPKGKRRRKGGANP
jgi:transcriptional regulator with XRE-family HTH domain